MEYLYKVYIIFEDIELTQANPETRFFVDVYG